MSKRVTLLVITLAYFLTPFMTSSINIALPSIGKEFALEVLRKEIATNGKIIEDPSIAGWDIRGVPVRGWQEAYVTTRMAEGVEKETAERSFRKCRQQLLDSYQVKIYNKMVWINGQPN